MKNKKLIICWGLPGSGKTTLARKLSDYDDNLICEADKWWYNITGEYLFIPSKIGKAHQWCQSEVRRLMQEKNPLVIVSNTSLTRKDRQTYIDIANEFDYEVEIRLPESPWFIEMLPRIRNKTFTDDDVKLLFSKNTHEVPWEVIKNMLNKFEE